MGIGLYYWTFHTEFAENGSVYDYIHVEHKDPSLVLRMLWAKEVVEGRRTADKIANSERL